MASGPSVWRGIMREWIRFVVFGLTSVLLIEACAAPPQSAGSQRREQPGANPTAFKRITAAIRDVPPSFVTRRTRPDGYRGLDAIEELAHAGFTYLQADGT